MSIWPRSILIDLCRIGLLCRRFGRYVECRRMGGMQWEARIFHHYHKYLSNKCSSSSSGSGYLSINLSRVKYDWGQISSSKNHSSLLTSRPNWRIAFSLTIISVSHRIATSAILNHLPVPIKIRVPVSIILRPSVVIVVVQPQIVIPSRLSPVVVWPPRSSLGELSSAWSLIDVLGGESGGGGRVLGELILRWNVLGLLSTSEEGGVVDYCGGFADGQGVLEYVGEMLLRS